MSGAPFAFGVFARVNSPKARPICRPAAAPINGVSAAAGRRGLGAGPRPSSSAGSEMRKREFMPPASTDGHGTRNRGLTCPNEIAELTVHYCEAAYGRTVCRA